jgi:hypothetical protein
LQEQKKSKNGSNQDNQPQSAAEGGQAWIGGSALFYYCS